jgi:hypothetical protein
MEDQPRAEAFSVADINNQPSTCLSHQLLGAEASAKATSTIN